ncbi:MAG: hypothetical protein IT567_04540 [Alphaproteobacteria bacterium]|nr:hypothetical protein [Alphaproteobacteria bacterium]
MRCTNFPVRMLLLAMMLFLAACGFQPLYAKHGAEYDARSRFLSSVAVAPIDGRAGQILTAKLEDMLGTPEGAAALPYELRVKMVKKQQPVAIEKDRQIARYNDVFEGNYQLIERASGKTVDDGLLRSIGSYNVVDSDFATYEAEKDAFERAASEMAEALRLRLVAYAMRAFPE